MTIAPWISNILPAPVCKEPAAPTMVLTALSTISAVLGFLVIG